MEQDKQPVSPFYSRPTQDANGDTPLTMHHKNIEPPNSFARAAMVLSVVAIVSVFTFTVYPPLIFGSLAIILALLSRGGSLKFHPSAKTGIRNSLIALGINIALVAGSLWLVFCIPEFSDEFNATFQEMYGMTYEEFMESVQDGTFDYDDYYDRLYEYMSE